MKAEEKAKELFNKYCYAIRTEETDSGYFTNVIYAKQCAIIAVDELIESTLPSCEFGGEINNNTIEYWIEVKNELEKL
jgi:hypothetical protein